jgi:hypothetical protein
VAGDHTCCGNGAPAGSQRAGTVVHAHGGRPRLYQEAALDPLSVLPVSAGVGSSRPLSKSG